LHRSSSLPKKRRQCNKTDSTGFSVSNSRNIYYSIFIAGQIFNGVGAAAIRTLGTVFIDENLSEKGTPMALGYFQAAGQTFGPAVGFIGGGALLKLWVDGNDKIPENITSEMWIGNWWLGFLAAGAGAVLVGILITGLPKKLESADGNEMRKRVSTQVGQLSDLKASSAQLKYIQKSTLNLLRNWPFITIALAQSFEGGFRAAAITYSTFYVEKMFG